MSLRVPAIHDFGRTIKIRRCLKEELGGGFEKAAKEEEKISSFLG